LSDSCANPPLHSFPTRRSSDLGMVRLGLLKGDPAKLIEEKKFMQFYMHNLGHFLGIDVHDAGRYYFNGESRPAEPGMVMTIEPGLYISADTSSIPKGFNQEVPA